MRQTKQQQIAALQAKILAMEVEAANAFKAYEKLEGALEATQYEAADYKRIAEENKVVALNFKAEVEQLGKQLQYQFDIVRQYDIELSKYKTQAAESARQNEVLRNKVEAVQKDADDFADTIKYQLDAIRGYNTELSKYKEQKGWSTQQVANAVAQLTPEDRTALILECYNAYLPHKAQMKQLVYDALRYVRTKAAKAEVDAKALTQTKNILEDEYAKLFRTEAQNG